MVMYNTRNFLKGFILNFILKLASPYWPDTLSMSKTHTLLASSIKVDLVGH